MSLKRIPTPAQDAGNWGTILNNHLAQTQNPLNGAFNSFDQFSDRPTNLTAEDAGKTYLYTQTGNWHEWSGSEWKVQNKSEINVKDYGAVGDGVANDTVAIQFCLNNFKSIYFPAGVFGCNTMNIPSNKSLKGDGSTLSEIRNINKFENHFLYSENEVNITIDSLYLNGNKNNRLPNGASASGGSTYQFGNAEITKEPRKNNILIKNCTISGNGFNNIGSINSHHVLLDGCNFINGRDSGIAATIGCSNWTVVNSDFDSTMLFPISFSNNGVGPSFPSIPNVYDLVDQARNVIISNNKILVGSSLGINGDASPGFGIEIDACRNVVIANNIITITQKGFYGIRIFPSYEKPNNYDCNHINVIGNTIINQSSLAPVGIELYNNTSDVTPKYIKLSNNIIINEITSGFVGISAYNMNKAIIENNVIGSLLGKTMSTGILLDAGNATNVDILENDISGCSFVGIQCGDTTNTISQKVSLTNNKVYGNGTNLGLGIGWEFTTKQLRPCTQLFDSKSYPWGYALLFSASSRWYLESERTSLCG